MRLLSTDKDLRMQLAPSPSPLALHSISPFLFLIGGNKETVTVNSEPALVETARTQVAGTVIQNEVNTMPLNGRSFLDLTLLIPGVSLPIQPALSSSQRLLRCPARDFSCQPAELLE